MDEVIKLTFGRIRVYYALFCLAAVAVVVTGEVSDTFTGMWADDAQATYLGEMIAILAAVTCVPLALKGFAHAMTHRIDGAPIEQALRLYARWNGIRLALLALPVVSGLAVYYASLSVHALFCACIGLIASLFCLPSLKRLKQELHIDKETDTL